MLRRYLITNGISTALLYAGIYAAVTPAWNMLLSLRQTFDGFVMESPILGPLVNKVVIVMSSL
jgi:hypothetical protein